MKKYVTKRVLTSIFTLLVILLVLFILMQLMPGSPFNDEKLNDAQRAALYAKYGLDQPVVVQFFRYVKNMLTGDFGVSYNISKNTPISQLIATQLPARFQHEAVPDAVRCEAGDGLERTAEYFTLDVHDGLHRTFHPF